VAALHGLVLGRSAHERFDPKRLGQACVQKIKVYEVSLVFSVERKFMTIHGTKAKTG